MGKNRSIREGRRRLSVAHLLTALAALFVVMPFVDRWRYGQLVESAFFSFALLERGFPPHKNQAIRRDADNPPGLAI